MVHIPTIETVVYQRLDKAIRHVTRTAGLGVVRGPIGVGKSYALADIVRRLSSEGINAFLITNTTTIEGHVTSFANALLSQYGQHENFKQHAVEEFERLIMGSPFTYPSRPSVLIVDEAQTLKIPVMETLRGLWDKGDGARMGLEAENAFGLVLVGNSTFLNRAGGVRSMDLTPIVDRITLNLRLHAPDAEELAHIANTYCPDPPDAAKLLAEYGVSRGNVRAISKAYREAVGMAEDGRVTRADIETAIVFIGGV